MRDELTAFLVMLEGPKFVGLDTDGSRKDWIATRDVKARLAELRSMAVTDV